MAIVWFHSRYSSQSHAIILVYFPLYQTLAREKHPRSHGCLNASYQSERCTNNTTIWMEMSIGNILTHSFRSVCRPRSMMCDKRIWAIPVFTFFKFDLFSDVVTFIKMAMLIKTLTTVMHSEIFITEFCGRNFYSNIVLRVRPPACLST